MRWRFQIPIIVDERSSQGRGGFAADSPRPGLFTLRSPFQAARHEIEKAVLFFHGFVSGGMGYPVRAVRRSMLLTHASFGCFLCSPLRCVPILTQARSVLPPDCSGHLSMITERGVFQTSHPRFVMRSAAWRRPWRRPPCRQSRPWPLLCSVSRDIASRAFFCFR